MHSFRGIDRYKRPKCTEVSNQDHNILFVSENVRRVFAKLRKATTNFVMSVRPHGTTRLPLNGFSWNLIFEDFSKICRKYQIKKRVLYVNAYVQCVRKVAVHLGYGRVQLKCDGTRWRTGGQVRKVAVHLGYVRVQLKCDGTRWCTGRGSSESRCALIKGVGSDVHSIRQFPFHFPSRASPCAITFQLDSTVA